MKTLNNLKDSIKHVINSMNGIATFSNGYNYGRYFAKSWDFMGTNRMVLDLSRYNSHLIYNEKEKNFQVSDQLVQALRNTLQEDFDMTKTTHVGCFDIISPAIYKQAMIDGSSSVEELNEKLPQWEAENKAQKQYDKLQAKIPNKPEKKQKFKM